ncbi:hypothetical protein QBC35DRAFT_512870 [Podospora australis]|uniref:Calcineurin-like phosphoesterase domain-containing protein n=1 Tax=Podospora australis TaxID=1536484 RepID=A0AAN6WYS1_9PEZI|nr:hypothetical protein QBC35DRAFT_512870 [Podospora australis]
MPAFQIVSDLHLEMPNKSYNVFDISPAAPNLALLGDIGLVSHKDELQEFILRHLLKFRTVFYLLGNHEAYHSTWSSAGKFLQDTRDLVEQKRQAGEQLGEFIPLNLDRYDFERRQLQMKLNDFHVIGDQWTPDKHSEAHDIDLAWLNEQVASLRGSGSKIVIFTHHSPTTDPRANDPRHDPPSVVSCRPVGIGHTHFNCNYVDLTKAGARKRIYTNQRGYCFSQSSGYDQERVIQI